MSPSRILYFLFPSRWRPVTQWGANVQRVLSLMKLHNMALCNGQDHRHYRSSSPSSSGSSSSSSIDTDLAELLLQLQDEFGQMSW